MVLGPSGVFVRLNAALVGTCATVAVTWNVPAVVLGVITAVAMPLALVTALTIWLPPNVPPGRVADGVGDAHGQPLREGRVDLGRLRRAEHGDDLRGDGRVDEAERGGTVNAGDPGRDCEAADHVIGSERRRSGDAAGIGQRLRA